MTAWDELVTAVKGFEGFEEEAYLDLAGTWTVGYGTTDLVFRRVVAGDKMTVEVAEQHLLRDLRERWLNISAGLVRSATPDQLAALTSFAHNLGLTALRQSTLLGLHNRGRYAEAAKEFDRWVYAGGRVQRGLFKRRAWERMMYESREPRALVPI